MENNTGEEYKELQEKKDAENPVKILIPTSDTEADTPNQEKENMDVHHHKHHEAKRGWKTYFWEFLMLFLALVCGSLAEYGPDHKIENDRKEQYIETMVSDLKEDTNLLSKPIARFKQKGMEIDS